MMDIAANFAVPKAGGVHDDYDSSSQLAPLVAVGKQAILLRREQLWLICDDGCHFFVCRGVKANSARR
jgi:hypothetical protein